MNQWHMHRYVPGWMQGCPNDFPEALLSPLQWEEKICRRRVDRLMTSGRMKEPVFSSDHIFVLPVMARTETIKSTI